jgi:hypothetical protein
VLGAILDGDYIWLGGRGFLTVMDARNGKILQSSLFTVRGILLVHERFGSLQVARNNVWFTANNNVYRVPKPY